MQGRTTEPGEERKWRIWRRTDGGYGQIHGSDARSFKETGSRGGFSLGSDDEGRSLTPMIAENNNDLNVNNNRLINISVSMAAMQEVLKKLVPEAVFL